MKLLTALLTTLALCAAALVPAQADDYYGKQKVVYHINYDDAKQQDGALRNVRNHIDAVGADNIEIKIVLHGPGIDLLVRANDDEKLQTQIAGLKAQNVGFAVCNNTLKARKLDYEKQLYDTSKADIVPAGVAELARLQGMGYTYIKP